MLWEWRGIANMDFIELGGSSRVGEMILVGCRVVLQGRSMGRFLFVPFLEYPYPAQYKSKTYKYNVFLMRSEKAKEKEVAFRDVEETPRLIRSTTTLQPLLTLDPKDKGKGVLVKEEHVIVKRRDQGLAQIESDAELAQRLYEEELAEVEIAQKERQTQEEASMAALYEEYDTIQASIDADALFAAKLQQEK
ncbi:hypothetical protein Tco_1354819 [Tanacetum coccineum]